MFSRPVFTKSTIMLVGLTAGSFINAQTPHLTLSTASPDTSISASKPDPAVTYCATTKFMRWVRDQSQPVDAQLKAAKRDEINKACAATSADNTFAELIDGPPANLEAYLSRPGIDINERRAHDNTLLDIAANRNNTLADFRTLVLRH